MGATIFNGNFVKTLKDQLKLRDTARILTGTDDPTVVAKDAEQGSLYLRTGGSGGDAYLKQDAGSTTNWTILSAGGGAGGAPITRMVLAGGATIYTTIDGYFQASGAGTLTGVRITAENTSATGTISFRINKNGASATTGNLTCNGGVATATTTPSVATVAGDYWSADITALTGTGEDFTIQLYFT